MLPILTLFFFFPSNTQSDVSHSFNKLKLPIGSEAYAFDSDNLGSYTGLNDGRIVKYAGPAAGFLDFATTSPNSCVMVKMPMTPKPPSSAGGLWASSSTARRKSSTSPTLSAASWWSEAPAGATPLASGGDGVTLDALDAIAIHPVTGEVYFTDVGPIFFTTTNMTDTPQWRHRRQATEMRPRDAAYHGGADGAGRAERGSCERRRLVRARGGVHCLQDNKVVAQGCQGKHFRHLCGTRWESRQH